MSALVSVVWGGIAQSINQPWGCTTLDVEPYWAPCASKHFHCGVDIGNVGCKGQSLFAVRAGTVVALSPGILGIRAATGETDYYVHGTYVVAMGQVVSRAQRIGAFGDVVPAGGALFGAHLHFEVQAPGGRLNYPGTSRNPVVVLTAAEVSSTEDDMLYIGSRHAKPATLRTFAAGSIYRERTTSSPKVKDLAKGSVVTVDAYCYSQAGVVSSDLAGTAPGAQPGIDYVWWHIAGTDAWIPDAILDTSKLVGAPTSTIPATETLNPLFATREEVANLALTNAGADDDSALATKADLAAVAAKIPTKVTVTAQLSS